ncbi:uncharacterized protein LOC113279476 [Papaver somniferum]|uniref:uncharacterized protein LOC113279476 n=1 Tax=Papaver somniferum TaxID=3469 RepID=UPI000E6FC23A|nr:uncharacterized protein LOC113279476 [Papaver somniferum]
MRVIFWNINGVAKLEAGIKLRELVREYDPQILCIDKPKIPYADIVIERLNLLGFKKMSVHNYTLTSMGNLWILWSEDVDDPLVVNTSRQAITVSLNGVFISFVHASYIQVNRRRLWNQLNVNDHSVPWLVIWDFNCVLRTDEKKGGREPRTSCINKFSDWMDDNELFEDDALGATFIWANGQSGVRRIISKLDRAIINEAWLNKFSNWRYFMKLVHDSWNAPFHGTPAFIFPYKMKRLKVAIKLWNQQIFGNVNVRLKQAQLLLENALRISDEDHSDESKFNTARDALAEVQVIRNQQKIMLKQKSRNKWLLEGSSNTSYFHNNINIRRGRNTISELVSDDGSVISDSALLCDHIVNYYEAKFNGDDTIIDDLLFDYERPSITAEQSGIMDAIHTLDEIKEAVFGLDADSARGPDGFSGCFYRHCWDIIQLDLTNAIIFCWQSKTILSGVNSSLIVLLAKVRGANTLWNFRPIGLSNFLFKIFTKILTTRMDSVLGNLVLEEQVAFMKGRNIHENISFASEMVNELKIRRKDGNLGLKLDISQAFDTVSWSFVLEVFRRYGFSENWCTWIHHILQSARISILMNGSPEGFFKINRGLRQGDPLSLIFMLIEDVLSRNISKLFQNREMTYMVTRNGISPTHLFFVDDIMIFCKGNMHSVTNLVNLLERYRQASGQTVCRQKSKIYYGGGSLNRRQSIADFFGMAITTFPDRYLGVKIMPGAVKYSHISNVVDKLKDQLTIWNVLSSYSIHNMAIYKWPKKFIQQCERVIRNFLWSGDSNLSRSFVVGYDKICRPYKEGGLGIPTLEVLKKALLMKLWWNIKYSSKAWSRFLETKLTYRNGKFKEYGVKSTIHVGMRWVYKVVDQNTKFLIGDGRMTSLYYDIWYGEKSISDVLNRTDLDRQARVGDLIQQGSWVIPEEHMEHFPFAGVDVNNLPRLHMGSDRKVWMPDFKGKFSVKSAKELVCTKYIAMEGISLLWNSAVHPNLAAQNWKFLRGACATLDKVKSRFKHSFPNKCMVCKCDDESLEHVYGHATLLFRHGFGFLLIHEYSYRLKSFMYNSVEDVRILNLFRVAHRKVKHVEPITCYWKPPESNELLLCCDGAACGNPGVAGAGVVEKDADCNMLGAMSIGLGITTNYLEEMYGIIVGLEWARQWGFQRILIRSDSTSVIKAFEENSIPWFAQQRWLDVRHSYVSVRFTHTFCEANFSADQMAKKGCSFDNEVGMHYVGRPNFLSSIEYPNVEYFIFK